MGYKGLLAVDGVIRLDQFWPKGKSDGDTVSITIPKGAPRAFTFRPSLKAKGRVIHTYDKALSFESERLRAKYATKVVTQPRGKANAGVRQIRIRMQGIDAPELHFKIYDGLTVSKIPPANRKVNIEYYQPLSASAALVLRRLVQAVGTGGELPCQFRTRVDKPDQAIDKYGRFVGDVYVTVGGTEINLNNAMLEQGLVIPAFYESMLAAEITEKIAAAKNGSRVPDRMGNHYRGRVGALNRRLKYAPFTARAKQHAPKIGDDRGPALHPKLYRRLCAWTILRDGRAPVPPSYEAYLRKDKSLKEIFLTREFLRPGRAVAHDFFRFFRKNTLQLRPEEVVFKEARSFLFTPDGKRVSRW